MTALYQMIGQSMGTELVGRHVAFPFSMVLKSLQMIFGED
jgi:hypothetical protein